MFNLMYALPEGEVPATSGVTIYAYREGACVKVLTPAYRRESAGGPVYMNSPRVIELPRRLEAVTRDTFLGGSETAPRPRGAEVIPFRTRGRRVRPQPRRGGPAPRAAA
jgi:hypothetical protein